MASFLHLIAAILALLSGVRGKRFSLVKTYDKENFFDEFHFNTTGALPGRTDDNGSFVEYYNKDEAFRHGLAGNTSNDEVYLGVEHENPRAYFGRGGLRLVSRDTITHGLIIANFTHMPKPQCGGWPAFWTLGAGPFPNGTGAGPWPDSGEINIYEGWNLVEYDRPRLYTSVDQESHKCRLDITSGSQIADILRSNCGKGCQSEDRRMLRSEYGRIYALVKTSDVIEIYQWDPNDAPANLHNHEIDTQHWGMPSVRVQKSLCDIDYHFKEQRMMFSLTFCGNPVDDKPSWEYYRSEPDDKSCFQIAHGKTCMNYVAENPDVFQNFYFQVKDIRRFDIKDETTSTPDATLVMPRLSLNPPSTSTATVDIPSPRINTSPAATTLVHATSSRRRLNTSTPTTTLQPVDPSSPGLNTSTTATPLVTSLHRPNLSTSATPLAHVAASSHQFNASTPAASSHQFNASTPAASSQFNASTPAASSHQFNASTPVAALARIAMPQPFNTSATHPTVSSGPSSLRPNSSTLATDSRVIVTKSRDGSSSWFNSSVTLTATSSLRNDTATTGLRTESSPRPSSLSALGSSGSSNDHFGNMPGAEAEDSEVCEAPSPDSASPALGTPGSSTQPREKPFITPAPILSAELEVVTIYNTTTSTTISTIRSCPSSVKSCTSHQKITKTVQVVVPLYTTVCPVTAIETRKPTKTRRLGVIIETTVIVKVFRITKCPEKVPNCPLGKISTFRSTKTCLPGECGPASSTAVHTRPGSVRPQDPAQAPASETPANQAPSNNMKASVTKVPAAKAPPHEAPVSETSPSKAPVNRGHANKASVDDDLVEEDPFDKAPDASQGPSDASTVKVPVATLKPIAPDTKTNPGCPPTDPDCSVGTAVETTSHRPKESANSKPDAPLRNPGNKQDKTPATGATAPPAKIPDRTQPKDDTSKSRDPEHYRYPGQPEGNQPPDSQALNDNSEKVPATNVPGIEAPGDENQESKIPEASDDGGHVEPSRISRFGSEGSGDIAHDSQPSSDGGRVEPSRVGPPDSEVPGDAPHDANIAGDGNGGSKTADVLDRPAGAAKPADPQRPTPATKPLAPDCVGAGCQSGNGPSRGTCTGENCPVQVNSAAKKCASFLVIGATFLAF